MNMQKRCTNTIPFLESYTPVETQQHYKDLTNVPNGKFAQKMLRKCETGLSQGEFDKLAQTEEFQKAIAALAAARPDRKASEHGTMLQECALLFWRLKKYGKSIPWELYKKSFPCLARQEMEPAECRTKPCAHVLTLAHGGVLCTILLRADIMAQPGGFFADRLITALELGVPFERIRQSRNINLSVAIDILKKYIPECSAEWIEDLANRYEADWNREPEPPQRDEDKPRP